MPVSRAPLIVTAVLVAIVALGVWLRMVPFSADPGGTFLSDAAFHERMTMTSEAGAIPARDLLADAPEGRVLGDLLPLAFYPVVASVHRALAPLDRADIRFHSLLAIALFGGLIALPVFAMCRAVTRDDRAALCAALVAVVLPAHLHRTFCWWFRYESLGTLILTAHIAFGVASLAAHDRRARWIHAAAAGLTLWAALAVWRVSFMLPLLESGFVALLALVRPPGPAVRTWLVAVTAGGTLACLTLGYLRAQNFLLSAPWVLVCTLALALFAPPLQAPRRAVRVLGVGIAMLPMVALAGMGGRGRQYGPIAHAALERLVAAIGRSPAGDAMTALALSVDELASSSPADLFGPGGLSWLGAGLLLALAIAWLVNGRRGMRALAGARDATLLVGFLTVALGAITLLFVRNKVLLAPLFAVAAGAIAHALLRARTRAAPAPRAATKRTRATPQRSPAALAGIAILTLAVLVTAWDAYHLAATRRARLDPGLAAALEYLRARTPPDAIVLSTWERGYEIQAMAGRRTLVDGLLEDPVVQGRIPRIAGALLQPGTDSLAALCRATGARFLLVPSSQWMLGVLLTVPTTMRTELASITGKVAGGRPLTASEADRILVRMMVLGEAPSPFEKVFESNGWRVYRMPEAAAR